MKSSNESLRPSVLLGRLLVVYGFVVLWTLLLVARLAYLQLYEGDRYQLVAQQQQHGFTILRGKRGEILDRNLEELAISVQVYTLTAEPDLIHDRDAVAAALAPILSMPPEEILAQLTPGRRSVQLSRKVVPRQAEEIRQLGLTGVFLQPEHQRFYPDAGRAAQVLGFVGRDGEGLGGLEYRWDKTIQGQEDRVSLQVDARRKSYSSEAEDAGRDGSTLVLNLHGAIQYLAETTLEQTVTQSGAIDGTIVVMDPHTGEILAMASYPGFDPNHFQDFNEENYRNRAILQSFEPGSTMKIVTLAAVYQEGLVDLDEVIDCRVGTLQLAGKVYREATRSFDQLTFQEILAKSSNIGTIKLALRLGPEKLYEYLQAFGFGDRSGVDLPGEQEGLLRPTAQWSKISIGALAIGQELAATPLQVLRAVAAIANGGYLVRPYLVRQVLSPDGELEEFAPQRRQILRRETAHQMKKALANVVTQGTGTAAALNRYSSAGKTGTAQKFVDGKYSKSLYLASYVGFAPVDDPVLAAIVVINEPKGKYYGGHVAGPAFKEVMEQALQILRVPPEPALVPSAPRSQAAELEAPASVSVSEEPLAAEDLEDAVLTLIDEQPDSEAPAVVQVETDLVVTPDFKGQSLRDVARQCAVRGLRLKVSGSGKAVGQRPLPGRRVRRGSVCEVFFSIRGLDNRATESADSKSAAPSSVARRQ